MSTALEKIERQQGDIQLVEEFWKSDEGRLWRRLESDHRYIRASIIAFLRINQQIPFREQSPDELIATAHRIEKLIRSRWVKKAVKTRRRKKQKEFQFERAG